MTKYHYANRKRTSDYVKVEGITTCWTSSDRDAKSKARRVT